MAIRNVKRLGEFRGTLVLVGAGKMGSAMLDGWLARERSEGRIVQQCLSVDPALAAISPGALPTLRVVTVLDERGVPEVTDIALRLSLADTAAASPTPSPSTSPTTSPKP